MWLYRYHRYTHTKKKRRYSGCFFFFFSFHLRQAFQSFCSIQIKTTKKRNSMQKFVVTVDKNFKRTCSSVLYFFLEKKFLLTPLGERLVAMFFCYFIIKAPLESYLFTEQQKDHIRWFEFGIHIPLFIMIDVLIALMTSFGAFTIYGCMWEID